MERSMWSMCTLLPIYKLWGPNEWSSLPGRQGPRASEEAQIVGVRRGGWVGYGKGAKHANNDLISVETS